MIRPILQRANSIAVGLVVLSLIVRWPACSAQETGSKEAISVKPPHYPKATPESQGLTSADLDAFGAEIEEWVKADRVVGASLLVVKNRNTVYRKSWGWADRESKLPMREDAIVNWRSMTKPVGGTAIQMLIDEGKLAPEDKVAKYLPSFKGSKSRDITLQQLLTHHAGYSQGMPADFQGWQATMPYKSALDLAKHWGETGPVNIPGGRFDYADANADTLAGLVEKITGESCGKFVRERILSPLSMDDTFVRFAKNDTRKPRIAARYGGGTGQWVKRWSTADGNYYPFPMLAKACTAARTTTRSSSPSGSTKARRCVVSA